MATAKKTPKRATSKAAKPAAKRMGRPPKGNASRSVGLGLRVTPEERSELHAAAEARGMSVTDLILLAVRALR